MLGGISGDYFINTQNNYLETHQLLAQQSSEDADLFEKLFDNAIKQGLDPNDTALQQEIFSKGQLGWNGLLAWDRDRVVRHVEATYKSHTQY